MFTILLFLAKFIKQANKYCGAKVCKNDEDLRYGTYKNIDEAEMACLRDDSCHMVMDKGCKVKGPFQLCRSRDVCESHIGSCVYHKIT